MINIRPKILNQLNKANADLERYLSQNQIEKATILANEILEIINNNDITEKGLAMCLPNLSLLCRRQNDYENAELYLVNAIKINGDIFGLNSVNVAMNLHNLADLYINQERFDEAENTLKTSLVITQTTLGPVHPYVVAGLTNKATLYSLTGRQKEANKIMTLVNAINRDPEGEIVKNDKNCRAIFNLLILMFSKLAKSDGIINEKETKFVSKFISHPGFARYDKKAAMVTFDEDDLSNLTIYDYASRYLNRKERYHFKCELVVLMSDIYKTLWELSICDGTLNEKEAEILRKLPLSMDINAKEFEKLYSIYKTKGKV